MTEQALGALDLANKVKAELYDLKQEIRGLPKSIGAVKVAEILEGDELHNITLGALLTAIKRVGVARAEDLLYEAGIRDVSLSWRIERLTLYQRLDLASYLRKVYEGRTD